MGRILLLWRMAARDIRRHPIESLMVFIVIAAAAATLTTAFALSGVTNHPYGLTRAVTAGPDVVADIISGLPDPNGAPPGQPPRAGSPRARPFDLHAATASLVDAPGVAAHSGPYLAVDSTLGFHGHRVDVVAEGRDTTSAIVDQPKLVDGVWVRPDGAVLERGFADALNAHVGDRVIVGGLALRVVGVAVTAGVPAYPSSLCHLACVMTVPQNMGLVWITRSVAARLSAGQATTSYLVNLRMADPSTAPAFVAAHQGLSTPRAVAVLYAWQSIRDADAALVEVEQVALQFGGVLLGLLSLGGLAVLVGRRVTEQTRRVGLLKAVGATPATVGGVLLFEHLVLGLGAAGAGLVAGRVAAPLLTSAGSGLLGTAGAAAIRPSTAFAVAAAALGVATTSALAPAIRAVRSSTVAALEDSPRVPRRRPVIVALSARLPVSALLGLRQLARRPRRALLNALSVGVTATGIVAVLANSAQTHASAAGTIANIKTDRLNELLMIITVMIVILAVINTSFIAWATATDTRFSSALERALGASAGQATSAMVVAAVTPAVAAALLGLPLGIEIYHLLQQGQSLRTPPGWQLAAVALSSVVVVATLTGIPSRLRSRRPPAEVLRAR